MKRAHRLLCLFLAGAMLPQYGVFAQNKSMTFDELTEWFLKDTGYRNDASGFNANDEKAYEILSFEQRDVINETGELTVNVNYGATRELHRELFGVHNEAEDVYDKFFEDGELREDFLEYQNKVCDVPLFRWGGTTANHVNFLYTLGELKSRKATPAVTDGLYAGFEGSPAYRMGIIEQLKMIYANNPDAEFMPCISPYVYTVDEVENFAHLLLDPPTTEWGKKRAQYGIENPVKVFCWEMGNEVDKYTEEGRQWYINAVRPQIEAIKRVDPEAKICMSCTTAPWGRMSADEDDDANWRSWHRKTVPYLADVIDMFAFHPYYDGNTSEMNLWFIDIIKKEIDDIVKEKDIRDENGNLKDIKILGTEGAKWDPPHNDFPGSNDFKAAISTSHFLNLAMQREWYAGNVLHSLCQYHLWGFWSLKNNTEWLETPTEKLYTMYQANLGDRIIDSPWCWKGDEDKEFDIYKGETFSNVVMRKGKNQLKIFLTNKLDHRDLNIDFNFGGVNYTLIGESKLTAPNLATFAYNTACDALTTIETTEKNEPNFSKYHMDPQCIVVLTLETGDNITALTGEAEDDAQNDTAEEMDSAFSDTENHWAKNEIAYLKDKGIVSGKTDTEFYPDDALTKAQLAAMLCKTLNLPDYAGSVYDDVGEGDWYAQFANALYFEGMENGKSFYPNNAVTVPELCEMLYKYGVSCGDAAYDASVIPGQYSDIPEEYKPAFAYCIGKKYLNRLYENGCLKTDKAVTRAEAASVIYQLFKERKG